MKIFFFETIKKSIYETANIIIEYKTLEQITFLKPDAYKIDWKMNDKVRRYDLNVALPSSIISMDGRKAEMRERIVEYLKKKEQ